MGLWNDVQNAVENGASDATNAVQNGVGDADNVVGDIIFRERLMSSGELTKLQSVFWDTLPYGFIWITNQAGLGGRVFTAPHPFRPGNYAMNVGPEAFDLELSIKAAKGMVHEATHIWQGWYYGPGYLTNSAWSQGCAETFS